MFTNFCFSENLLAAAANRFKILKKFISLNVTAYIQDRDCGLRNPMMSRVSNGNLIVPKQQNIHMISNIKQRKRERQKESKTQSSSLLYIQQRRIQNPFQHLSKEVGDNYFCKNIHIQISYSQRFFDVVQRCENRRSK